MHLFFPTVSPKILLLKALSSQSLFIRWKAPLLENHKGEILNYLIRWRPVLAKNETDRNEIPESDEDYEESSTGKGDKGGKRWLEMIQDAVLGNSAIISGLNAHTIYEVSVAAGNGMGYGPGSEPEQEQTDEDGWCCFVVFANLHACF
ncbi:unnamed protein product [Onchocerca flexuosa]|uniref:Fibronectin type-III domain-containing protein n=1 Tax=Onchocerca flexuosa TaxID=387005 RepID=A0A183HDC8_9BILA|nr:unnamed protein product [Onchocerca flexuosa]